MLRLTIAVSVVSLLYWFVQGLWALAYVTVLRRGRRPALPKARLPKFCVGMPLRGADPHLRESIQSILAQDYPDFELRITIDSAQDPAWNVVAETVQAAGAKNVRVTALKQSLSTCSRMNGKQIQFLEGLDDSCELVAFAAGDLIVPRDWLRNMATALADPSVGATLGNRWYVPAVGWWGTLVRYLWNVGAVVPMWMHEIPWAGGLAMRLADVKRSGLIDKMKHSMVEDAQVKSAMRKLGLKMKFVPPLIVPNREEITLPCSYRFIERQLLWTKLYHPHWTLVVLQAVLGTAVMFGPAVLAVVALAAGDWLCGLWNGCDFAAYITGMIALTGLLEWGIRPILRSRQEKTASFSCTSLLRLWMAVPLAQLVHNCAVVACLFKKLATWRGVTYRIRGPWDIEVLEDKPCVAAYYATEANVSVV